MGEFKKSINAKFLKRIGFKSEGGTDLLVDIYELPDPSGYLFEAVGRDSLPLAVSLASEQFRLGSSSIKEKYLKIR